MLNTHFADSGSTAPSKEVLDTIVESSNGDIRSAIMALQFACIVEMPGRKAAGRGKAMVMEAMTRREQSLDLFHLLGKVLYNKRLYIPAGSDFWLTGSCLQAKETHQTRRQVRRIYKRNGI